MAEHEPDGVQFPPSDDTRSREEEKNQPHYLGDKVDEALERMEAEAPPMSEAAQQLLDDGIEAIHRVAETPDEDE